MTLIDENGTNHTKAKVYRDIQETLHRVCRQFGMVSLGSIKLSMLHGLLIVHKRQVLLHDESIRTTGHPMLEKGGSRCPTEPVGW